MYKGAIPHFKKMQKTKINQVIPNDRMSLSDAVPAKYIKICSIKYQSKVNNLK